VNHLHRVWIAAKVLVILGLITFLGASSDWRAFNRNLNKADKAVASDDSRAASLAYARAAWDAPWRYDLWEQAGLYSLLSGERQIAKSYLERVEGESDLTPQGLMAMGDIADLEGETQMAIGYWEDALAVEDQYELHFRLADAYFQLGDLENAAVHQTSLVDLNPTSVEHNLQLGMILAALDPEAAPAYLSHAVDLDPELSERLSPLVRSIRSSQRSPDPAYAFVSAGQSLASMEEWSLAEVALSKATQLNPEFADAWAYLGEARQQLGEDGFDDLETALQLDPDSIPANTLVALYWQRQEQYDMALVYIHSAANLDPLNPALEAEIGNTLGLLGNLSSAETHYVRAVEMAPNDPTYWQILANFYIRYESNLREDGLAAARQAVILAPDDPASLDAMAQIYLLMESPHIARRFLERALTADSTYAPAHLHMGLVHIMNGNTLESFQKITLAKELSTPGSPTAELADRLLETHFP
jgi:tetratricopeptide (TPR) repeat protein